MKVNVKKLCEDAVIPSYAQEGDAGLDLTAVSIRRDDYGNLEYGIGLAIEIPEGFEGQIRPRSSIRKTGLAISNTPGTVDSGYRGELMVNFRIIDDAGSIYEVGDRVAQLVIKPVPHVELVEVETLSETKRGAGAYGSTGK